MATDIKTNFITTGSEREDETALLGSLTAAFGEALDFVPGLLAVQRGLLGGLALSQRQEAKRLARKLEKDDPRVRAAMARAQAFDELRDDAESGLQQAERVTENVNKPGVFFGYVRQADGSPAPRLEVRLVLNQETFKGEVFKADTDDNGFFRIQVPINPGRTPGHASVAGGDSSVLGTNFSAGRASVHDEKGQELYRDPLPPSFEETATECRIYMLGMHADLP